MVKVLTPFTDRESKKVYRAGDAYDGTAARIAELAEKGYVEKPKTATRAKSKAKAKTE